MRVAARINELCAQTAGDKRVISRARKEGLMQCISLDVRLNRITGWWSSYTENWLGPVGNDTLTYLRAAALSNSVISTTGVHAHGWSCTGHMWLGVGVAALSRLFCSRTPCSRTWLENLIRAFSIVSAVTSLLQPYTHADETMRLRWVVYHSESSDYNCSMRDVVCETWNANAVL